MALMKGHHQIMHVSTVVASNALDALDELVPRLLVKYRLSQELGTVGKGLVVLGFSGSWNKPNSSIQDKRRNLETI